MLQIKCAEDFGLGFNCMSRLYMDHFEEEILNAMIKISKEYLKWFSYRTLTCSLRDLIREYPYSCNESKVPEEQTERYEALIMALVKQAIYREKMESNSQDADIVYDLVLNIGVVNSYWGVEKNFNRDSFYQWVTDNGLLEPVETQKIRKDDTLPLKKRYVPLFYKVCNYMINYSYGRHTYMPSTCRDFVKANMVLMSDNALGDIVDYLKKKNAHIPEDESDFDKIDSDNWIYMQEDLESELITRDIFCLAQEKAGSRKELQKLLKELTDFDSLYSQKDCMRMYHQIMGIERYLKSVSGNANIKNLLKQLEADKKIITEKRWKFFEKEEGDKYERIGEGLYRRK